MYVPMAHYLSNLIVLEFAVWEHTQALPGPAGSCYANLAEDLSLDSLIAAAQLAPWVVESTATLHGGEEGPDSD